MIEDIVRLRRKGLSFRKIAKELDSTVGKVQYQWTKHSKVQSNIDIKKSDTLLLDKNMYQKGHFKITGKSIRMKKDGLVAWLTEFDRLIAFWRLSPQKKKLVSQFFGRPLDSYVHVLKIYDVTSIIFDGTNAHSSHEIILKDNNDHWLVKGLKPGRCYCLEYGIKLTENKFLPVLRSNAVHVPRTSMDQVGQLAADLSQFLNNSKTPPNWIEHVSTYSYYEKLNKSEDN